MMCWCWCWNSPCQPIAHSQKSAATPLAVDRVGMVGRKHQLAVVAVNAAGIAQQAGTNLVTILLGDQEIEQLRGQCRFGHRSSP
jgi:hypothetical protein